MGQKLTIGRLARRAAVSVKTLRFYSDAGLLPPVDRSRSGYRLYTEEHAQRLALIRTLREAGVGLEDIGKVLRKDLTLGEVLRLRLAAVEAHITSLQRVAAALRAAIDSGASEAHLRRITMVTHTSNEERRQTIADFYAKVVEGIPADPGWVEGMIDASHPVLNDTPTAAQLAAWAELQGLLEDPSFCASKRLSAADMWAPAFRDEGRAFVDAQVEALLATKEARERGVSPSSEEARAIVDAFAQRMATAAGLRSPEVMRRHLRLKYDPRGARYWELVAILKDEALPGGRFPDWQWLGEALTHHVREA